MDVGLDLSQRFQLPQLPSGSSNAAMSCSRIVGEDFAVIGLVGGDDAVVVSDGGLSCSGWIAVAVVVRLRSRLLRLCSMVDRLGCSRSPLHLLLASSVRMGKLRRVLMRCLRPCSSCLLVFRGWVMMHYWYSIDWLVWCRS
jgi:hypothetical protein